MAKLRKWRVLVLERHFKIGGFTHTFTRPGGWSWDVGLHYVGEMGEGMMGRQLFDLITEGGVKWSPLPDVYDVFVYVEYSELATPLTFEHFTAAPSGTIYGYPATPQRYRTPWLAPRTPIENLYLTGSDAGMLGIMGALTGGLMTARCLLGSFGLFEVMRAARSRT
jgi:phytoene dehydrogenase-like protein